MKKLSISLFAILAIAFAVTSAFTSSKKAKLFFNNNEVWAFNDQVIDDYESPVDKGELETAIADPDAERLDASSAVDLTTTLEAYLEDKYATDIAFICDDFGSFSTICSVAIGYDSDLSSDGTVFDVVDGEFIQ